MIQLQKRQYKTYKIDVHEDDYCSNSYFHLSQNARQIKSQIRTNLPINRKIIKPQKFRTLKITYQHGFSSFIRHYIEENPKTDEFKFRARNLIIRNLLDKKIHDLSKNKKNLVDWKENIKQIFRKENIKEEFQSINIFNDFIKNRD